MGFKQTNEELDANKAKVDKAFLPAVLGAKAWVDLLPSLGKWLLNNCTFDGFTDGSVPNMIRGINALSGTGLFDWEVAPVKQPPKKDFQQSNDGPQRPNHARKEEKAKVVQLAANDVNSPVFQQRNHEARLRFEDLLERGPISYRGGSRLDRGLTAARREILKKIRVIARQRDAEGAEVALYENMVTQAEEQIRKFEQADSKREMS
jgi:hypothetical protein